MMLIRSYITPAYLFVLVLAAGCFAQSAAGPSAAAVPVTPRKDVAIPFIHGETLTYEGKISKIIRGIAVADITFTVSKPLPEDDYVIKAVARSKGTLLKLARFSFRQEIESSIQDDDFRVEKTKKVDVQKERVRESEAIFDHKENQVTYIETDPKEPMRPPRKIASEITTDTHDMLSAVYRLRMLPLTIGETFDISVSDSGLVYNVPVKVAGRERIKTALGKVWCFRLEPQVFGPGRLVEREGSMTIWITEDSRRLPVRSQVNTSFGRLEIKLKSASSLNSAKPAKK